MGQYCNLLFITSQLAKRTIHTKRATIVMFHLLTFWKIQDFAMKVNITLFAGKFIGLPMLCNL